MERQKALTQIITSLTSFGQEIESETSQGYYDILRHSEEFYAGLLNLVYGFDLAVANYNNHKLEYDLVDVGKNIAFEITFNSSLQKIKAIVNKVDKRGLRFSKFYIFLLKNKPRNYSKVFSNLDSKSKYEVLDTGDLIEKISSLSLSEIDRINEYLITSLNIKQPQDEIERRLTSFITLIEKEGVRETEITQFLAVGRNQFILKLFFGAMKVHDEILCERQIDNQKPNLQPDFFVEMSNGYSDIVDFKLPSTKSIVVGKDNRERFSASMNTHISQVENYRDYFDETNHREHIWNKYDIKVLKPTIYLVIGRRGDFDNEEWKRLESRYNRLVIKHFDDVIDVVQNSISLFRTSVH